MRNKVLRHYILNWKVVVYTKICTNENCLLYGYVV